MIGADSIRSATADNTGGWHTLSPILFLTTAHDWMIPLQYVTTEELV